MPLFYNNLTKYRPGHLRNQGADVTLMVHSDMLAYHVPGEHPQLAFPKFVDLEVLAARLTLTENNRVGTQEVNDLIHKVASIYSPELAVGSTPVRFKTAAGRRF